MPFICCLSLDILAHRGNLASLSLFYRYYFGRCSSELAQLVALPYSRSSSTCYCNRLHDFSVTIPRCYKDFYVNNFFPCTARLWTQHTPLIYRLFPNRFPVGFNLFVLLFLVSPCPSSVTVQ